MRGIRIARRVWHHFKARRRFSVQVRNYEKHIKEVRGKRPAKARIVFLVNFPEAWNSVKSIYEEAVRRNEVEAFIVAVPRAVNKKEQSNNIVNLRNEAYEFFAQIGIDAIKANSESGWFDLKELHPDYVIYTRPYNQDYPEIYESDNVCTFAKICYIPYAYSMLGNGLKVLPEGFVLTTHRMYLATESRKEECRRRFPCYIKENRERFQYVGFPRFDLYSEDENLPPNDLYTIAWLPRWTVDDGSSNKGSHFLQYMNDFFEFAQKNPDIRIIFRPHPNMFPNYIEKGIMSREEVDEFHARCDLQDNFIIDTANDYIDTIKKSDLLVADYTSLITEFFMTGKPVIYCDTAEGLNYEGRVICDNLYKAASFSEITKRIEMIRNDGDKDLQKRKDVIRQLLPSECGSIGKTILDSILLS